MKPLDTVALLLLAGIWGSAFLFIDVIVDEVEPLNAVAARLVIGAAVLVPAAWLTGSGMPPRESWGAVAFMSVFNNVVPFSLITAAQEHIESSLAAVLIGTMPLFVLIITFAAGTERPSLGRVVGLLIGFVGAIVIIGPDLGDITNSNTIGQLAVLGASVSYAASTVVARERAKGPPLSLSAAQLVLAAVIAVPIALVWEGPHDGGVSVKVGLALLALGAGGSGVAYILFYGLVQRVAATQAAVVGYLIPVVAAILGWAALDEHLGPELFVGLALILAGVAAVNGTLAAVWSAVRRTRHGDDERAMGQAAR